MVNPLLTEAGCLRRQERLRAAMARRGWELFLTGNQRTVYSLTAAMVPLEQPALFLMRADGETVLISPQDEQGFADERRRVPVYSPVYAIEQPVQDAARVLTNVLPSSGTVRMGVDLAYTPAAAVRAIPTSFEAEDATAEILALRRTKDDDEVDEIRRSLRLNAIAYDAAKRALRPGMTEIDLHAAMSLAVAEELGTTIPLAGDFSCGMRSIKESGPPTARRIEAGELCVLDLFIAPAYYYGDTCRTFCAGKPDTRQREAWLMIQETLRTAEKAARPGVPGREVYKVVRAALDASPLTQGTFWHHAGHGIGYQGHEAPRLIPESEDTIAAGDVIAIEPGIYVEALRGGIRLENSYRVGKDGLENLFEYPMAMTADAD